MSYNIRFFNIDQNYVGFEGNRETLYELREKYSFYAPNYKWDKRFKLGYWDGKITMLNMKERKMYAGLLPEIKSYLDSEKISYLDETDLVQSKNISLEQVYDFYEKIGGPFVPHESQALSFQHCVNNGRNIVLAPTSNGKSYIIHGLNAYYKHLNKRVLLVIHRSQLVLQLKSNFVDEYDSDRLYSTSTIYEDDNDTDVVITTWQSIVDQPQSWFKQFGAMIFDEVHTAKAKSLINIVDKCGHIEYRHGFTATLDNDSKTDAMTLEGMFGTPFQSITLEEQIEQGISAKPIVYLCVLRYSRDDRLELIKEIKRRKQEAADAGKKNFETLDFTIESEYLETHENRTNFIIQLAKLQKGNTLIAFKSAAHGKTIYEKVKESFNIPVFFANGTVKKEKRFEIQQIITELLESVAVVSFGTFSTGVNIPNLNNLIIASQIKSQITVPQLVGRLIRLSEGKTTANIIDICDDLSHNGKKNIFLLHFEERMKFYIKNGFDIRTKIISI